MDNVVSCYWNVWINGTELDNTRKECISSLDITEQCDGSDTLTLVINDPNFLFIEDNIFVEEASVSAIIGWHGDTHINTFDGYISAIDIDFPEDGFPVLSIFCLDGSHVMNRKKKSRSWDNTTRDKVVQEIAQEYGFKCVIESGYTFDTEETISQSNATDIEFCESLAGEERDPFMCKLIGDTIYYVKKGVLKDPTSTVYYRQYPYDVVSFKPQINKETKQVESSVSDVTTDEKEVDSATATDENTSRDVSGTPVNTRTYNPRTGIWEVSTLEP